MDPLTAVGLAASIVQLLDFGFRMLRDTYDIYVEARELPENLERCERHVKSTCDSVTDLQNILNSQGLVLDPGRKDKVKRVVDECKEDAKSLSQTVMKLKSKGSKGSGGQLVHALRAALWDLINDEDMKKIEKRFAYNEHILILHIDLMVLDGQSETRLLLRDLKLSWEANQDRQIRDNSALVESLRRAESATKKSFATLTHLMEEQAIVGLDIKHELVSLRLSMSDLQLNVDGTSFARPPPPALDVKPHPGKVCVLHDEWEGYWNILEVALHKSGSDLDLFHSIRFELESQQSRKGKLQNWRLSFLNWYGPLKVDFVTFRTRNGKGYDVQSIHPTYSHVNAAIILEAYLYPYSQSNSTECIDELKRLLSDREQKWGIRIAEGFHPVRFSLSLLFCCAMSLLIGAISDDLGRTMGQTVRVCIIAGLIMIFTFGVVPIPGIAGPIPMIKTFWQNHLFPRLASLVSN